MKKWWKKKEKKIQPCKFTSMAIIATSLSFKKIFYLFIFRERERKEEREGNINVWLPLTCPLWGIWLHLQPKHVPWLGIEPTAIWFVGQCSVHWATPARPVPCLSLTPWPVSIFKDLTTHSAHVQELILKPTLFLFKAHCCSQRNTKNLLTLFF